MEGPHTLRFHHLMSSARPQQGQSTTGDRRVLSKDGVDEFKAGACLVPSEHFLHAKRRPTSLENAPTGELVSDGDPKRLIGRAGSGIYLLPAHGVR